MSNLPIDSCALLDPDTPPPPPRSFLRKKNYGRNPIYLDQRINEQEAQKQRLLQEMEFHELKQSMAPSNLVLLPEPERIKILAGLRANWDRLNTDYQKLSLTVDTVPKIARYASLSYFYYV